MGKRLSKTKILVKKFQRENPPKFNEHNIVTYKHRSFGRNKFLVNRIFCTVSNNGRRNTFEYRLELINFLRNGQLSTNEDGIVERRERQIKHYIDTNMKTELMKMFK